MHCSWTLGWCLRVRMGQERHPKRWHFALTAPPPPCPPSGGLFWANWACRVVKQHLKHSLRHFGHLGQELQQAWLSWLTGLINLLISLKHKS